MLRSHPILKSESEILKTMRDNLPPFANNFVCFFSSHLKAYITDPLFMSIPLEDKMVHRGYGVFETTKVFGNKIYQLDSHIERMFKSMAKVNLKSKYSHEEYREILMKLASIARSIEPKKDIEIRYFYSAGLGNMSLIVKEEFTSFYAVALLTDFSERPVNGINERLVSVDAITKNVSTSKTTNYLVNALVTKQAKESGGYLGIMYDEEGNLLETSMSNIAFVLKSGEFLVPPFDKTLVGTTVVRVMDFIEKELIPSKVITSITRSYINVNNYAELVQEAMLCGGDFVIPILKLNDTVFSEQPGAITRRIQEFLINDKKAEEVCEEIPILV